MARYKVVCTESDYAYTFDNLSDAQTAAGNHNRRKGHAPVHIYELEDLVELTRDQLLACLIPDPRLGVLNIYAL